eukprot:gene15283-4574_t
MHSNACSSHAQQHMLMHHHSQQHMLIPRTATHAPAPPHRGNTNKTKALGNGILIVYDGTSVMHLESGVSSETYVTDMSACCETLRKDMIRLI